MAPCACAPRHLVEWLRFPPTGHILFCVRLARIVSFVLQEEGRTVYLRWTVLDFYVEFTCANVLFTYCSLYLALFELSVNFLITTGEIVVPVNDSGEIVVPVNVSIRVLPKWIVFKVNHQALVTSLFHQEVFLGFHSISSLIHLINLIFSLATYSFISFLGVWHDRPDCPFIYLNLLPVRIFRGHVHGWTFIYRLIIESLLL